MKQGLVSGVIDIKVIDHHVLFVWVIIMLLQWLPT